MVKMMKSEILSRFQGLSENQFLQHVEAVTLA